MLDYINPNSLLIEKTYQEPYNGHDLVEDLAPVSTPLVDSVESVESANIKIGAGVYFDIIKEEDDDCEEEEPKKKFWFLPFNVETDTEPNLKVDSNFAVNVIEGGLFEYTPVTGGITGVVESSDTPATPDKDDPIEQQQQQQQQEPKVKIQGNHSKSDNSRNEDDGFKQFEYQSSGPKLTIPILLVMGLFIQLLY